MYNLIAGRQTKGANDRSFVYLHQHETAMTSRENHHQAWYCRLFFPAYDKVKI